MYRYVIRNTMTGTYIHKTLLHIMYFYSYQDAVRYMTRHNISRRNYEVEVITVDRKRI